MIDAGKLRHKIDIQQFNGTVDSHGDIRDDLDQNWTTIKTVWASINPVSGREFYQVEQRQSEVTHKIIMRYFPELKTEMRIRFGDRKFRLISVINWEERNESFLIMAKELVS